MCDGKNCVPSARLERAPFSLLKTVPLPLGYEGLEPPLGADPSHLPYEGRAAAVRGGIAGEGGVEPPRA